MSPRGSRRNLLAAALLPVLAACVGLPAPPSPATGDAIGGRLALRVAGVDGTPARVENPAFELHGNAVDGRLDLSTPLGSVLARVRWSPGEVVLATTQGQTRYPDLDALTRDMLGAALPVAALFDWLRGRPWDGAPLEASPDAGRTGFAQLGWEIDLDRFDDGIVVARRRGTPETTVRIRLDR